MELYTVFNHQGRREYMEDHFSFSDYDNVSVAMVCDGHGGSNASETTIRELPTILHNALNKKFNTNIEIALEIRTQLILFGERMKNHKSGTTLTGVAHVGGVCFIFNIGDSRTCVDLHSNSPVYKLTNMFKNGEFYNTSNIEYYHSGFFCTTDHNTKNDESRILDAGGSISENRLQGILSVTRAYGDSDITVGLSYVPDVYWIQDRYIKNYFMLISDGIYEITNNSKQLYLESNGDAKKLVEQVYRHGSSDNLTAMFVKLK